MKKITWALLILVIAALILGGCSKPAPAPAPTPAPAPAPTPAPAPAPAAPTKLVYASSLPPIDKQVAGMAKWIDDFKNKTGGRYTVEISTGSALGKPDEYYNLVSKGVCDMVEFFAPYVSSRFPMSQILTLPFVTKSSEVSSKAFAEYYKKGYMDNELSEVVVLFLHAQPPGFFYTAKKSLNTLADLNGLKVRTLGGMANEIVKSLGATPVYLPIQDVYTGLEKGTVDGIWTFWPAVDSFKIYEVANYCSPVPLSSGATIYVMNKNTYNKMPEDVKTIIKNMINSNEYLLYTASEQDKVSEACKKKFLDRGGKIPDWSQADITKMGELLTPIWAKWIADGDAAKLPSKAALNDWYNIMKGQGIENPTPGYKP